MLRSTISRSRRGGIIITNVFVFFLTTVRLYTGSIEMETFETLCLQFYTINPLQWLTAAFMHADLFHLIGNMFFLWVFGLVIEGKIGAVRFLGLYGIVTLIDNAIVQIPMFVLGSEEGFALGASGTLFGLMFITLIWAPENCIDIFYWITFIFVGTFELQVSTFCSIYVLFQIFELFMTDFGMSSAMLHMVGGFVGLPFGFLMLNRGMVDCEDWDIVARNENLQKYTWLCPPERRAALQQKEQDHEDPVTAALAQPYRLKAKGPKAAQTEPETAGSSPPQGQSTKGRNTKQKASPTRSKSNLAEKIAKRAKSFGEKKPPPEKSPADRSTECRQHTDFNRLSFQLRQALEQHSAPVAQQNFDRMHQQKLSEGLTDATLMAYVRLMMTNKQHLATMMPLHVLAGRGGLTGDRARLQIAQVQSKVMKAPGEAIKTLSKINPYSRPESADAEPKVAEEWEKHQKVLQQKDLLLAQIESSS